MHHREERQTGVRGRAAACRSARGRRPAPSLGLHRPLAPSHTGAHASSRSESQGRLGAGRSWQNRSFLARWGWLRGTRYPPVARILSLVECRVVMGRLLTVRSASRAPTLCVQTAPPAQQPALLTDNAAC